MAPGSWWEHGLPLMLLPYGKHYIFWLNLIVPNGFDSTHANSTPIYFMSKMKKILSDVSDMILSEEYGRTLSRDQSLFDTQLILFGLWKVGKHEYFRESSLISWRIAPIIFWETVLEARFCPSPPLNWLGTCTAIEEPSQTGITWYIGASERNLSSSASVQIIPGLCYPCHR